MVERVAVIVGGAPGIGRAGTSGDIANASVHRCDPLPPWLTGDVLDIRRHPDPLGHVARLVEQ